MYVLSYMRAKQKFNAATAAAVNATAANATPANATAMHFTNATAMHFISAGRKQAMKFSVESVWDNNDIPLGVHKPWWGIEDFKGVDLRKLYKGCPEIRLLCPYARHHARDK